MREVTLTELRRNIFKLVDETLATGEPLAIRRNGRRVILRPDSASPRPARVETEEEREARWERFWNEPPPPGWEDVDLSAETLNRAIQEAWKGEPEIEI